MKIFHTADWHLGKLVQGVYMTEDQHYILQQFIQAIDEEKPDVIIIAGDLYDRSMPPIEAVNLLNDVLAKIVLEKKIPVLAVAGNHDSAGRLNFGSRLMSDSGLYIKGQFTKNHAPIVLNDQHGEVHFHLVPYAEPAAIRNIFEDESIRSHQDAMRKIIEHITEDMDTSKRHVFVGHAFVTKYGEEEANTSDSERPLSIGGSDCVNAALFKPFHYTALGHLHKAHFVLNETIRYSGSILKYSLSEHLHEKGFLIIELDEQGNTTVSKRKLVPRRDLRVIEGQLEELLTLTPSEDYVFVRLTDKISVTSPMERIRSVFPHAMHVERKVLRQDMPRELQVVEAEKLEDIDLFRSFFTNIIGIQPDEDTERLFTEMLQELLDEERETVK
ncbi:exonuclease SbcCD subunit D [Lysinibacillus sp. OL1_EC]|uniref:exonuclease SbcCD subunit D n=1 Tax=unclassified Lysinibacillus TaxID=2636778 RepID=UPI00103AD413|nr:MULTISPECIES: exonuclease SbcCD subunit D [unclassified Lysinibacillus]MCM0626568.1 exonuclease SbcCD subunit D [Lysinibacillus sp. OL1_EC]TBV85836.1 exonuclease SbcCD subunit D [Lysinibacillus sp. OL1]UKJ44885.1 exonuclease SbcCD subunit D [Lysinibacillus sp. ACHW1.5]